LFFFFSFSVFSFLSFFAKMHQIDSNDLLKFPKIHNNVLKQ
jgi:hypothetical protein